MAISIACSSCGKRLKVKDELAGKRVKCPGCQQVITVPAPEPKPAPVEDGELRIMDEEQPAAPPEAPQVPLPGARRGRPSRRGAGRALTSAQKPVGPADIIRASIGGVVGSLLGALLWFVVAIGLKMNIGWLAIGIGIAAGFGVAALSGGRGGSLLPFLGAGCAIFGFFAGEYMIYIWAIPDIVERELIAEQGEMVRLEGEEEPVPVRVLVDAMMAETSFTDYLSETFDFFSVLYIVLAVSAGFGIPKRMVEDS